MATFAAACYDEKGSMTMNETAMVQLMADKTSMTTTVATMTTTMATRDATIKGLETSKIALAADLKTAKADNDGEMPTWAIAIIVVIGAMFLLVVVILGVVVSRTRVRDLFYDLRAVCRPQGAARQAGLRANLEEERWSRLIRSGLSRCSPLLTGRVPARFGVTSTRRQKRRRE
eukprot:scaffold10960_cov66-Phaeocystis_antarctica.AAC.5